MFVIKAKTKELFVGNKASYHKAMFVTDINKSRTFTTRGAAGRSKYSQNSIWGMKDLNMTPDDFEVCEIELKLKSVSDYKTSESFINYTDQDRLRDINSGTTFGMK